MQGVAEGVNDYVQNITRLQTIVGLRADYNFLANTIKSYVEVRLQPSEDKYYLIELINDPRGLTTISDSTTDTTDPRSASHYRTITTTTTDSFRFSLQFAKRMGPFTGRFGIKESTGGTGLDIHLLQDRFQIVNDLFGFSEEVQPRYRVYISYEFLTHLWINGGVDFLFSPTLRDYFLGLELRFNDEDLKTILPFSGGAGLSPSSAVPDRPGRRRPSGDRQQLGRHPGCRAPRRTSLAVCRRALRGRRGEHRAHRLRRVDHVED